MISNTPRVKDFKREKPAYKIRWDSLFQEISSLKNTLLNVYDLKLKRFVFSSRQSENIFGFEAGQLVNKGINFWLSKLTEDDREKFKNFFFELSERKEPLSPNQKQSMFYHIKRLSGLNYYVLHEQRIIEVERFYVVNIISDLSEKELIYDHLQSYDFKSNPAKGSRQNQFPHFIHHDISEREHEVLILIAAGLSSKEIANQLFISNHTAISHRKNLIEKFHVKNTAELIKEASKVVRLD